MWERMKLIVAQSFDRIAMAAADLLPGLLAMLLIIVVAFGLAVVVRIVLGRFLGRIDFDRRVQQWGLGPSTPSPPTRKPALIVARIGYWLVLLSGFVLGLSALSPGRTSDVGLQLLGYVPRLLVAVTIFLVGLAAAKFLERHMLISAVNMQIQSARPLSLGVKWLVMVLATAMALEQLQIGGAIVTLSFAILFGGIVLALSLAVGLGARDIVSRSLEKRLEQDDKPKAPDDIGHL